MLYEKLTQHFGQTRTLTLIDNELSNPFVQDRVRELIGVDAEMLLTADGDVEPIIKLIEEVEAGTFEISTTLTDKLFVLTRRNVMELWSPNRGLMKRKTLDRLPRSRVELYGEIISLLAQLIGG